MIADDGDDYGDGDGTDFDIDGNGNDDNGSNDDDDDDDDDSDGDVVMMMMVMVTMLMKMMTMMLTVSFIVQLYISDRHIVLSITLHSLSLNFFSPFKVLQMFPFVWGLHYRFFPVGISHYAL